MCTPHSHTVLKGGNCLCGAIVKGHFCDARSLKHVDATPALWKPKDYKPITNEECCNDPNNCTGRTDDIQL